MSMFCHQCQETAGNTGCSVTGVCGKTEEIANLQDLLIWILQGISVWGIKAKELGIYDKKLCFFIDKALFATITNADFNRSHFIDYINKSLEKRDQIKEQFLKEWKSKKGNDFNDAMPDCANWVPGSPDEIVGKAESGDCSWMRFEDEDIRSLKSLILYGLKGISAYAEHAYQIKEHSQEIFEFLMEALAAVSDESLSADDLTALVLKTGDIGVKTMALLDKANTNGYGHPEISEVNIGVRNNPGILISGHDLLDLEELLEQTKGSGIDVYTHGEMLPAHYYPKFKKYEHLAGNYGGSWYLQKEEIEKFNGPILFTSNCLVPPRLEHKERIFTTGAVGFDDVAYIKDRTNGKPKDFSAIISMAKQSKPPVELEKGSIVGGFAHNQVLQLADKVIEAVKAGKIKRFIVMAGCDGRHKSRSYYTEVAEKLPKDTVILTAGCAKFRYNKLNLGDIDGIPRVLDAGQCNDSYSLAVIAMELQKAFGLDDINKLPVSFDIAWYEQKAVIVFLALLSLGFKGIRVGPTLPAFLSDNVAKVLIEKFDIKGITTADKDIAAMMAGN